jgi:hypothetical protein
MKRIITATLATALSATACVETEDLAFTESAVLDPEEDPSDGLAWRVVEPVPTDISTEAPTTAGNLATAVCYVYTDSGPSGRVLSVSHDYENLHQISSGSHPWNTWGDVISAVKCLNGGYIWAYKHSYFQGPCVRISTTVSTLHTPAWRDVGDKISSIGFMHKPAACSNWLAP